MAKTSGLGDNCYVGGYDLSGDVGALGAIAGGIAGTQDQTGINASAHERTHLLRDGRFEFTSFFNDASNQSHSALSSLPTTDRIVTYCRGTTLGNPAAAMVGKQINYDFTRPADGSLTIAVQVLPNAYGLEWGRQLTAGKRTDTGATNGASIDTTASAAFGAQAYLHVFSFSGTNVTVKIQDSADDSNWADVTGLSFTQITSSPTSERLATASGATIRRYLRAVTVTAGGFSALQFAVMINKNETSTTF